MARLEYHRDRLAPLRTHSEKKRFHQGPTASAGGPPASCFPASHGTSLRACPRRSGAEEAIDAPVRHWPAAVVLPLEGQPTRQTGGVKPVAVPERFRTARGRHRPPPDPGRFRAKVNFYGPPGPNSLNPLFTRNREKSQGF